jgi:excinuclease UvrABC nuclease subunit
MKTKGSMMAMGLDQQPGFWFTQRGIRANAPNAPGVYAIYNQQWIYFGESDDVQRRLLEHLNDPKGSIMQSAPTGFTFELVPTPQQRVARQHQLIAQYPTQCNQMTR